MKEFIYNIIKRNKDSGIYTENSKFTFNEFWNSAIKSSEIIRTKFAVSKSKVAILCEENVNTAKALLACWHSGFIPIPVCLKYGEDIYGKILGCTQPDLIITDIEFDSDLRYGEYNIFNIDKNIFKKYVEDSGVKIIDENLDDIAVFMSTSGTTGNPKIAMIRKEGLIKNVEAIAEYFKITKDDNILIIRPLYHCAVLTGEFLISLYKGTNIYFTDTNFIPGKIIKNIEQFNITVLCGTPTILYNLAIYSMNKNTGKEKRILNDIQTAVISGECLTSFMTRKIRKVFETTQIYSVYGLTEASPRVSYLEPKYFDKYPESVGTGLSGVDIKISGDEVYVKSESLMKGYYKDKDLTEQILSPLPSPQAQQFSSANIWLKTGDVGYIDKNGFLYIKGRLDDMIIKAGVNIYPKEIENKLLELPEIKEVHAYSGKNEICEEIIIDIVPENIKCSITLKEWYRLVSGVLPAFMLPSKINILDKFEISMSGKLLNKLEI